jgi:hypothetical protein
MEHVTDVSKNAKRHAVIPEYVNTFIIEIAVVTVRSIIQTPNHCTFAVADTRFYRSLIDVLQTED